MLPHRPRVADRSAESLRGSGLKFVVSFIPV
nr:MAG TPA: hypothetical protein [Caudoviricetes sp.]